MRDDPAIQYDDIINKRRNKEEKEQTFVVVPNVVLNVVILRGQVLSGGEKKQKNEKAEPRGR